MKTIEEYLKDAIWKNVPGATGNVSINTAKEAIRLVLKDHSEEMMDLIGKSKEFTKESLIELGEINKKLEKIIQTRPSSSLSDQIFLGE